MAFLKVKPTRSIMKSNNVSLSNKSRPKEDGFFDFIGYFVDGKFIYR